MIRKCHPALLLLVVVACTNCRGDGGERSAGLVPAENPSVPCPKLEPGDAPGPGATPKVLVDLPLSTAPGRLRLWGRRLASTPGNREVVVCDLATGSASAVATADEGPAFFTGLAGSGDVVVYSKLTAVPRADSGEEAGWAIEAVDLRSGRRRQVASGRALFRELPSAAVDGPWVVWGETASDGASSEVRTFDLRDGRRRTVATAPFGPGDEPGSVGVTGDAVIFDGRGGDGRRQLLAVPADGSSAPRPLAPHSDVVGPVTANGRVAWKTAPAGGAVGRWTMLVEAEGAEPTSTAAGDRAVIPGHDFLVAKHDKNLSVVDLRSGTRHPLMDPNLEILDVGSHFDVSGDLVVWSATKLPLSSSVERRLRIARVA